MRSRVRKSLVGIAALTIVAVGQVPAGATHGNPDPWVPNDRFEQVYFHCEGSYKAQFPTDGAVPWNTIAPTQSIEDGAGCGYTDSGITQITSPAATIWDAAFEGTFTGNLDKITVEAHNIYVGPARQSASFTTNVRLTIDGVSILGEDGRPVTVTPVKSSSGASELIRFTITGINLMQQWNDLEHDIKLTLSGGAVLLFVAPPPVTDTQSIWVYDATEVPSGLSFNPKVVTGVTLPR